MLYFFFFINIEKNCPYMPYFNDLSFIIELKFNRYISTTILHIFVVENKIKRTSF